MPSSANFVTFGVRKPELQGRVEERSVVSWGVFLNLWLFVGSVLPPEGKNEKLLSPFCPRTGLTPSVFFHHVSLFSDLLLVLCLCSISVRIHMSTAADAAAIGCWHSSPGRVDTIWSVKNDPLNPGDIFLQILYLIFILLAIITHVWGKTVSWIICGQ